MAGRMEGKVAFVTGAARGQGRSHAVRLAQEGADIIAVDICRKFDTSPADGSDAGRPRRDRRHGQGRRGPVVTAEVDVRDYDALRAAVDSGVEQLGRLDVIIANAGIGTTAGKLHKTDEALWQEMIDVNLSGVWKTVKAGVPHVLAGGRGGSIILTSSVAGNKAYSHMGHYVAAKHGVIGLMRSFAVELGQRMIRVNAVLPTHVNSPLLMNEPPTARFGPSWTIPGPDDLAPVCQSFHYLPIPWVTPEDISNAVLFLASDEARYITGVALPIDAGSCLK